MKWSIQLPQKAADFLGRYKYALLLLLLGVILLTIPGKREEEAAPVQTVTVQEEHDIREELETLLSQVQGAGRVRVMLTVAEGEETIYMRDTVTEERTGADSSERSQREETVLADSGSTQNAAVPVQVVGPVYRGAVVVAEGADQPSVRLDLTNAVMSLTGLGADKITVIKMKTN